jgi:hypothetical protein
MDFLPVTSDMQRLELVYSLHPSLSQQPLSFSNCSDIGLGLIETNNLKAVLSAQPALAKRENAIVTLRSVELKNFDSDKAVVSFGLLQQMNLRFEAWRAVIDDIPLMLPANTPYSSLVQHLVMVRLEYVLSSLDVHYLEVNVTTIPEGFTEFLKLRAY